MSKLDDYRRRLRALDDWDEYLLRESGLPGPRGNLELAQAVADEGDEKRFRRYLKFDARQAPTNSPHEFLAFCGAVGLGRLIAEGRRDLLPRLRRYASDPRWRMREAVATALQRLGDKDMGALVAEMKVWSQGSLLEKRAAAAALCEPRLLGRADDAGRVLAILDAITASIGGVDDRKAADFQALRKGLAYCWSVAVAALPAPGRSVMEKWLRSDDPDVRWIMKENLKKERLRRADARWVAKWKKALGVAD